MAKQLLLGSLLGGLTMFVWLGISWGLLPFHTQQFHSFPDEAGMQAQLRAMDLPGGLYWLPGHPPNGSSPETYAEVDALAKAGPGITLMTYLPDGFAPMDMTPMLLGLLYSLLAALCATLILRGGGQAWPQFGSRVRVCTLIGVCVALMGPLMTGAFFMLPGGHLALETADHVVGWTLMGLVLAWATRPASQLLVDEAGPARA